MFISERITSIRDGQEGLVRAFVRPLGRDFARPTVNFRRREFHVRRKGTKRYTIYKLFHDLLLR